MLCTSGFSDDVMFSFHVTYSRIDGHWARRCVLARRFLLAEHRPLWEGSQAVLLLMWPRTRDVAWVTALQSTGGGVSALMYAVSTQSAVMTTATKLPLRCGRVAACV